MDLLNANKTKNRILFYSAGVLIVAGIGTGAFLVISSHLSHTTQPVTVSPAVTKPHKPTGKSKTSSQSSPFNLESVTNGQLATKVVTTSGSVASFKLSGNFATLALASQGQHKTYALYANTLVFDGATDQIVLPTAITTASSIQVVTSNRQPAGVAFSDPNLSAPPVTAVILNSSSNLIYLQPTGFFQQDSSVYLLDSATDTAYQLQSTTPLNNAVTDDSTNPATLQLGDQFFLYLGYPSASGDSSTGTSSSSPDPNMYPAYLAKLKAQAKAKAHQQELQNFTQGASLKGYTIVSVAEAFVYPQN